MKFRDVLVPISRRMCNLDHHILLDWIYNDLNCIVGFILLLCTFELAFMVCIFMDFFISIFAIFNVPSFSTSIDGIIGYMVFFVELFARESWTTKAFFSIFHRVLAVSVTTFSSKLPRKEMIWDQEVVVVLWFSEKDE